MARLPKFLVQKKNSFECGAFVLAGILHAFGKLPAAADTTISYDKWSAKIGKGVGDKAAALEIYKVTGCGPNGYNLPSAMCKVAQDFGLTATASYVKGSPLVSDPAYSNELSKCRALKAGGTEAVYAAPANNGHAQAVCVSIGGGLHWLALGDNGQYMDPADGNRYSPMPSVYTFTGIWIDFS